MLYPSINEIKTKVDSRYTLVILAAKRAREILGGKPIIKEDENGRLDLVEAGSEEKLVSVAAHEIAEDLITYKREEE